MITTEVAHGSRTVGPGGAEIAWRGLARRGMLHSECQAVDHVRLGPGAEFDLRGREGTESAWFVLSGRGVLAPSGSTRPDAVEPRSYYGHEALCAGSVVLAPDESAIRLVAGSTGLELLWISVLRADVTAKLPARAPVFDPADESPRPGREHAADSADSADGTGSPGPAGSPQ